MGGDDDKLYSDVLLVIGMVVVLESFYDMGLS